MTALVLNSAIAGVEIVAFTLIRRYFRTIYEPRTFIPKNESQRASPMSSSLLGWPLALWNADPKEVLEKNGADPYCYLLFLRMIVKILLPIWFFSWVILLPVDAANTGTSSTDGLTRFTFGNVGKDKQERYAAHLILLYFFTCAYSFRTRG